MKLATVNLFVWSLFCYCLILSSSVGILAEELSRVAAERLADQIYREQADALREQLASELEDRVIKCQDKELRLLSKQFGQPPPDSGAALYISMHGGGNAPARVNDQQWRNQIGLYQPDEGYYVAPRAPTDTWNLWHEAHIDALLDRLILAFVVCKNVDPNRVYLMGYSAGGDGVYQLAPRMSDRFAAAAMMAGHPNETKPDGLRNLPFALFMGGDDAAYNRNQIAAQWRDDLEKLQRTDPKGYEHWVQIYPATGHWMKLKDREAVPWMAQHKRNVWPDRIVWLQDDVVHSRLYWLGLTQEDSKAGVLSVAEVQGQVISVKSSANSLVLYLNDNWIDLDLPIQVQLNGKTVFEGRVQRTEKAIRDSLQQRFDLHAVATAVLTVP